MSMTTSSAKGQAGASADLTPKERLHEVASILAAGLLRLRTRPQMAATADMPGEPAAPEESSESCRKALELRPGRALMCHVVSARETERRLEWL